MKTGLVIAQIVVGIILSAFILLQAKGVGLGRNLGGQLYHSKRGIENLVFRLTIVLCVAFTILSILAQVVI